MYPACIPSPFALCARYQVLEQFGGDVLSSEVSSVTREGLGDLFDQIALQADMLDLKVRENALSLE